MTGYPTIRITCDPASATLGVHAAMYCLRHEGVGEEKDRLLGLYGNPTWFRTKRTKTGVTVRQIEGRAV